MGFLDSYLTKFKLDDLPAKAQESLAKVEKDIEKALEVNEANPIFDECVKQFGPQVADLVERFNAHFANMKWSISTIGQNLRFVINIGTEVYQIVEQVGHLVVLPNMTDMEKHNAKVNFGKQLCYFIWMTVNPLKDKLSWIPFKKTIEKKLVFWIAGMALEHTVDLFAARGTSLMSADSNSIMKALP